MTMEALQNDFKEILTATKRLNGLTTVDELVTYIKVNLVPFIESHVTESSEMDECIADILEHAEDILQPDTAKIFAGCIAGGVALAQKLEELAPKDATGKLSDPALAKALAEYRKLAQVGGQLLEDITLPEDEDDEEDDEDEDDDEAEGEDADEEDGDEGDEDTTTEGDPS